MIQVYYQYTKVVNKLILDSCLFNDMEEITLKMIFTKLNCHDFSFRMLAKCQSNK